MRKLFKVLHKWLAIPVGLIIVVICLTGCILVFDDELLEFYYPERYFVKEVGATPIPLDQLIPLVEQQLDTNTVAGVKITSDPTRTYTMTLEKGFRISAFVDPYSGELMGIYNFRESFFYDIMSLHRWLMDGTRTWGKYTIGITTLIFTFILISGLIIWIPRKKKKLKSHLTVKTSNGRKRLFYDLHVVLGIYACLFLLVCSLTGPMWSFDWYRNGVYAMFGAESPKENKKKGKGGKNKAPLETLTWQNVLSEMKALRPDYNTISIQDGSATVLSHTAPHLRAGDKYGFDNKTGEVKKVTLYADSDKSTRIMGWVYVLHVGEYGGVFTKILTCLASLIGASLPLTGYYMYFTKSRKKKYKKREKLRLSELR